MVGRICGTLRHTLAAWLTFAAVISAAAALPAQAACDPDALETFLADRVFTLSAKEKIGIYAAELYRYYGKRDQTRDAVYRAMRRWETRWPDRIYKYMRIVDYRETEAGDACRVDFDYKFIAYDPRRDRTSAGLGRTTLVLAERSPGGPLRIVGEWGDVLCRGLSKFNRSRC